MNTIVLTHRSGLPGVFHSTSRCRLYLAMRWLKT